MSRLATATITNLQGQACEGVPITCLPEVEGFLPVTGTTDAAGVARIDLATDVPYALGLIGGYWVDGQPLAMVGVIRLTVPEGDEPIALTDCATQILATEWPVLLRRLEAVETELAELKAVVAAMLEVP